MNAGFETIDKHFETYAKTTTDQSAMQGFVSWAWDTREAFLEQLNRGDVSSADDIQYSLESEQALKLATTGEQMDVPFTETIEAWLRYHREELIEALTESLAR